MGFSCDTSSSLLDISYDSLGVSGGESAPEEEGDLLFTMTGMRVSAVRKTSFAMRTGSRRREVRLSPG
jgi:hypothetical protein